MSVGAHTPGPWQVTTSKGDVYSQVRNAKNWICQGPNDSPSGAPSDERGANARLIAAAPDMLVALERLLDATVEADLTHGIALTEEEAEARAQAQAALAKARGVS